MPEDLAALFPEVFPTTEGWKADCPYCGKKQKLWWNEEKNLGEYNAYWNF